MSTPVSRPAGALAGVPRISFEYFPPATPEACTRLLATARRLDGFSPAFVSVTFGAGGSARQDNSRIVSRLLGEGTAPVAAHLTCVGNRAADIREIAGHYLALGVRHIVALRGDWPADGPVPAAMDYRHASELVTALKNIADFDISVAAYPEIHPEAVSAEADLDNLVRKFDAGASRAITQFFFDADVFLRFRDRVAARGISQPVIPGILPVVSLVQVERFAARCGASIPDWLRNAWRGLEDGDDPVRRQQRRLTGAAIAGRLCASLAAGGVQEFHFYTLNRFEITHAICRSLGLCERTQAAPGRADGPGPAATTGSGT